MNQREYIKKGLLLGVGTTIGAALFTTGAALESDREIIETAASAPRICGHELKPAKIHNVLAVPTLMTIALCIAPSPHRCLHP
jgi:hypothetical protein